MIMSNIIHQKELMHDLNIKRPKALVEYLVEKRIPYDTNPKGEVWTVQRALDNAILKPANDNTEEGDEWELDHAS